LWISVLTAPEVADEYDRLGLPGFARYFGARAAPLGAASPELVVATFFNFSPAAVAAAVPAAWEAASPGAILAAQSRGIDRAFRRAFAAVDPQAVSEAAALLKTAALAAAERPEGRPLFSAYASLPWPEEPHMVMFHAYYLLREFRGDGHIATMLANGFRGIDAVALHIIMVPMLSDALGGVPQLSGLDRSTVG